MLKDLGDLGVYNLQQRGQLFLQKAGRKFSKKKDPNTLSPRQFYFQELNPSKARVGDIVNLDDYRKSRSYVVAVDPTKKLFLMRLPDEGHSGYGTVPLTISSFFKNAIDAYKNIDDIQYIHLSPKDQGLKTYFFKGKTVPRKYTYRYAVSADEVEVHDPVTGKTLGIDRSGNKIGAFMTHFFKPQKTVDANILVQYRYNPERKAELQRLYQQSDENQQLYHKYKKLKEQYSTQARQFKDTKLRALKNILIKKKIVEQPNGGSGGSYHSSSRYILTGTDKNLKSALKDIEKLNQHGPRGSYEIKIR